MVTIPSTYDFRLVALSVGIAILASYVALDLTQRIAVSRGRARLFWLAGGAFAMGSGVWSMHYVGMLAYQLPIKVYYHIPTVILSLVAAVLACGIALYVASREHMTMSDVAVGSLLMGTGIATMHYTGMAAIRLSAMHHYNRVLWLISVFLAVVIAGAGMLLIRFSRRGDRRWQTKFAIALAMGLAISVMHYTGMAAASFMPTADLPDISDAIDISNLANGTIVCVTLVILGFSLLTSLVDRRLSENASQLALSNERYSHLFESSPLAKVVFDLTTLRIVAANHAALATYGNTSDELLSMTIRTLQPLWSTEELLAALQTHDTREIVQVRRDGTAIVTEVRLNQIIWEGKPAALMMVNDVSERKIAEAALLDAERNYREIFDEASFGMFQSTPRGRLLRVNLAMATMFGYTSPEEMTSSIDNFFAQQFVESKRGDEFKLLVETRGSVQNFECEVHRRDGSKIWMTSSARSVRRNGIVARYEGVTEDISERNHLREQLLQAQKLESVGQLAAGIAHEINTPTQYIGDNVRFLKDSFGALQTVLTGYQRLLTAAEENSLAPETVQEVAAAVQRAETPYLLEEIPKAIDQTLEGVTRVATLVSAMKEFSHPGTKEKTSVNLNRAIESTITVSRNEWKYVADLETDFDASLPNVPCLPNEFNQVILNLIVNAAHAIADVNRANSSVKGKISVQTRDCENCVEIRVQDTGTGIPQEAKSRVFDPFFTTKEVGKGTGQGLAIARSVVVDKHKGSIHFETEAGKGTTFIVRLPKDGMSLTSQAIGAHA